MKSRWIAGAFIVVAFISPNIANAWCQSATEEPPSPTVCPTGGEVLEWRRPCLTYAIDARGSRWFEYADVQSLIDDSFQTWLNVQCGTAPPDLALQKLQPSTCRKAEFNNNGNGNVNTIGFLDDWVNADGEELDPAAFAVTSAWHIPSTGEIVDADIVINENQGPYARCAASGCTGDDANLQSIVTHEIGHFFGIGHSGLRSATMYFQQLRSDASGQVLDADDEEAICSIYPPGSGGGACDFNPVGGLDLNCEDTSNPLPECVTREANESCLGLPAPTGKKKSGCSLSATTTNSDPWMWQAVGWLLLIGLCSRRQQATHRDL